MSAQVRVLVAEDQALLRSSLQALIRAEPGMEVVGAVATGEQAVRTAQEAVPDVVLMDIQMPQVSGIEATARICADPACQGTRILILTMFDLDDYVLEALRAGASGFLLKDSDPQVLLDAIRTVHSGMSLLGPTALARLLTQPGPGGAGGTAHEAAGAGGAASQGAAGAVGLLTPRQRQVLTLIARGYSNSEIETALGITRATCRTHITALLARLGARDRAQLVIAAYEAGLVGSRP